VKLPELSSKPKILFVLPQFRGVSDAMRLRRWAPRTFSFYSLSIPQLAAVTPRRDFDLQFVNEYWNEPLDYDRDADLVAISFLTPSSRRAYEVADQFRRRGRLVVMGGVHASFAVAEARPHADVLLLGEGEEIWPQFLRDFLSGRWQSLYQAPRPVPPEAIPPPDRTIAQRAWKLSNISLMATRGCPFGCDFCAVSSFFGRRVRCRPVDQVIEEIKAAIALEENHTRILVFKDDNLAFDKPYIYELLEKLIPLKVRWAGQANVKSLDDPLLVDLLKRSGCALVTCGLESSRPRHIRRFGKSYPDFPRVREVVNRLHRQNIFVWGSYMFGFDDDTPATIRDTYQQALDLKLDLATFHIRTPFPGTALHRELLAEKRIFEPRWEYYDIEHSVFHPRRMSSRELTQLTHEVIRRFYSGAAISRRMLDTARRIITTRRWAPPLHILYFNLAVRALVRELS
jgi:radical SAM superfamily enzyme YgiQ (UPF0313 family)